MVSIGDDQEDIEEICGTPSYIDSYQEEKTVKIYQKSSNSSPSDTDQLHFENNPDKEYTLFNTRTYVIDVDEWTYNFGSSRFIQTLLFRDHVLISIKEGSYGYDGPKEDFNVRNGDSKASIWLRYGEPAEFQRKFTTVTDIETKFDDDKLFYYREEYSRPIFYEEWIYDLGPNKFLRKLVFKDNVLIKSSTLKIKGKKG